jgi:hypothetical protein
MLVHHPAVLLALGGVFLLACNQPLEPARAASLAHASGVTASVTGSGHITRPDGSKRHFTLAAARRADGTTTTLYQSFHT